MIQPFEVPESYRYLHDRITKELPPRRNGIGGRCEEMIEVEEGVFLHTTILFPSEDSPSPTVLIRNPYEYDIPRLLASVSHFTYFGYNVVLQSCRGSGKSDGRFVPFIYEKNDGLKTIEYISEQPWQNGEIVLFGFSYLSFCQYILADCLPKQVKTMFLDKLGVNRYAQMYMNGMFRPEFYTAWMIAVTDMDRRLDRSDMYHRALEILPHKRVDEELFGRKVGHYQAVISNVDKSSEFWQDNIWNSLQRMAGKLSVPVLMCAGWFDHQIKGMIHSYEGMRENIKKKSRFVIGPWDHLGMVPGDYPLENGMIMGSMSIKAGLEWFDYQLKGGEVPEDYLGTHLYRCGSHLWEHSHDLPRADTKRVFYLYPGREKPFLKGGRLDLCLPEAETEVGYVYDPCDPVKTLGGNSMMAWMFKGFEGARHGPVQLPSYEERSDVLSFCSQTLDRDLEVSGSVRVHLFAATDAEDTAFTAKVVEITEDGTAYHVCDGITSIRYRNESDRALEYQTGEVVELILELWDICWKWKAGSKLRVDISSSNFPAYINHKNTKAPWHEETQSRIANQTLYFGEKYPTRVEFPVVTRGED